MIVCSQRIGREACILLQTSHPQSKLCRSLLSRHVVQLWRNHLLLHSMTLAKKVIGQIQKLLGIQPLPPRRTNHLVRNNVIEVLCTRRHQKLLMQYLNRRGSQRHQPGTAFPLSRVSIPFDQHLHSRIANVPRQFHVIVIQISHVVEAIDAVDDAPAPIHSAHHLGEESGMVGRSRGEDVDFDEGRIEETEHVVR